MLFFTLSNVYSFDCLSISYAHNSAPQAPPEEDGGFKLYNGTNDSLCALAFRCMCPRWTYFTDACIPPIVLLVAMLAWIVSNSIFGFNRNESSGQIDVEFSKGDKSYLEG